MDYDYFYEEESEQFAFYRIPKVLFTDERFRRISTSAKVLYGLLLDRVSLSAKNRWVDEQGRVYIYYTLESIQADLLCAVKSRFMKLDSSHLEFVLKGLSENTTLVRNMKQYLLAALYNAPLTINNYYKLLVHHDMAEGNI